MESAQQSSLTVVPLICSFSSDISVTHGQLRPNNMK